MPEPGQRENALLSLFRISNVVSLLNKRAEVRFGLSLTQWALLRELRDRPGCSPLALAEALRVAPGSLTQSLKRLARKGYLHIGDDPRDTRRKILALTRAGLRRLQAADLKVEEWSRGLEPLGASIREVQELLEHRAAREGEGASLAV